MIKKKEDKKEKKKSRKQLIKEIDEKRRQFVRKREQDWKEWGTCISCGVSREVRELQVGHYYSRIHDWTTALGGVEENTNLQCVPCNHYKRGNIQSYGYGLVRKYGVQVLEKLQEAKKTTKKYKISELESLIEYYKNKLEHEKVWI